MRPTIRCPCQQRRAACFTSAVQLASQCWGGERRLGIEAISTPKTCPAKLQKVKRTMGLASRMGALGPPGAAPSAPPAPSASAPGAYPPQQPAYGQPPQPAYGQPPQPAYGQPQATGGPSVPPGYTPPGQDPRYSQGYKPPGQQPGYGQPPPGQYGAPPGQPPPGQYGAPPGQYGAPPGQAPPGQYGAPPGQYGAPPGQPPPGQYGAPPGQYGAPPGQAPYGAPPGQAPYGAPPGQQPYGAPGAQPPYGAPPGQQAYPGNPPQQPAYGQPPQQPGYGQQPGLVTGGGGKYANVIRSRLQKTVQANGLAAFYPQQRLEAVVQRAAQVDFDGLTQRWQLGNVELALDLASLALYDIVLLCDDSGSMQQDDRIEDLTLIVSKISEVATLFDDDGIMVRFLNSNKEGNGIRTEPETKALLGGIPYSGTTPIGPMLQSRVLNTMVYSQPQLAKPVAVYVITDGEPDNRDEVIQTLRQCKDRMSRTAFGAKAVGFQFAQVGNDRGAMRFLESLDNDPLVGDVVDVTSHFEAEQVQCQAKGINLTPHLWLLKMLLGGVDPTYDEQD